MIAFQVNTSENPPACTYLKGRIDTRFTDSLTCTYCMGPHLHAFWTFILTHLYVLIAIVELSLSVVFVDEYVSLMTKQIFVSIFQESQVIFAHILDA